VLQKLNPSRREKQLVEEMDFKAKRTAVPQVGVGLREMMAIPRKMWGGLVDKVGVVGLGAISFSVATAGINISNFGFHIIASRMLGPGSYGAVGALLSIITVLSIPLGAFQLAVTHAVVNAEGGAESSLRRLTIRSLWGGVAAAVGLLAVSPFLGSFLHIDSLTTLIFIGLWIPIATVGLVFQGALIGEYRFVVVALASFVGVGLIRLATGVIAFSLGLGVAGAIFATLVGQSVMTFSLFFYLRRQVFNRGQHRDVRTHLRSAVLSIAGLSGYTALMSLDILLVKHYFSPFRVGQYTAASVVARIATFLPGAVTTVVFPRLAEEEFSDRTHRRTFMMGLVVTAGLSFAVAAVIALFSKTDIQFLFGGSYSSASGIVVPLAIESAILSTLNLFLYYLIARKSLVSLASWAGVGISAILIARHHQSPVGVAWTMVLASILSLIIAALPVMKKFLSAPKVVLENKELRFIAEPSIDLTIVVPFLNPGPRFGEHLKHLLEVLDSTGSTYEVIAVSDGSSAQSEEVVRALDAVELKLICLGENHGKGEALRVGFSQSSGRYIGFIDADGDISARYLSRAIGITRRDRPDVIYGSKRHPESEVVYPSLRRVYSWGFQILIRTLFSLPVRDTQTGLKVFRRDVLLNVLPYSEEKKFSFDLELFVIARRMGYQNFVEIPVNIEERFSSTVSFRTVFTMMAEVGAILYRAKVSHRYGRRETRVREMALNPVASDLD
jgi:O-antigen/teichoic acid export membrane protein